jgi:hypothetical protein
MSISGNEEEEDPIQKFIDEVPSSDDGLDDHFMKLINLLELSHIIFLHKKENIQSSDGNFTQDVVIPRIKRFNELIHIIEKANITQQNKMLYRRHVDLYSASTDEKVFEKVKKINAKKETKSFWIKSFNTSVIYKLFNDLNKHKIAMDIVQKNLNEDFDRALARALESISKDAPEQTEPEKKLGGSDGADDLSDGNKLNATDANELNATDVSGEQLILSFNNKEAYKKICTFYSKTGNAFASYYEFHKRFYLKHILLQRSYINALNAWIDELGDKQSDLYTYYKQFRKEINQINNDITILVTDSFEYIQVLGVRLSDANTLLNDIQRVLTETEQKDLESRRGKVNNMQIEMVNKINTLYNNTSAMAVILDNQFTYMYILKVITYGLMYLGLFFAEKIFSDMYTKTVYVRNQEPPNILTFYGIFLGFAIAMMFFVIVVLYIISQFFNNPLDSYLAINNELIIKYIIDMCVFHVLTGTILCVIGALMQRKKYFKYKTEGPRAIRAYSESISIITAITIMVPYFLVV